MYFCLLKVANLDINDAKGEALKEILDNEFGEGRTVYRHCDVADKNQLKGSQFYAWLMLSSQCKCHVFWKW